MNTRFNDKFRRALIRFILGVLVLFLYIGAGSSTVAYAQEVRTIRSGQYFTINEVRFADGTVIEETIINGPPKPPPGFEVQRQAVSVPEPYTDAAINTLTVPAFDWVFGCSAVSGAMIAGYYDRNGYPNMYTGPTNGGVMPLDNSSWPTWSDGFDTYPNCPLVASKNGVDGRATRGSIDDYWVSYESGAADPYITNGWVEHAWGDAIGDYMKTSQSAYGNDDGSTSFWNYPSAIPLTCANMVPGGYHTTDGSYGRKLFYEARGYTVTDCYNQKTDNQYAGGFSFAQFKAEIDAGRPVMLSLAGHTIVGVGYDDSSNLVYLHDTWDYATHTMTWGGSYAGMALQSVSIVNLSCGDTTPDAFTFTDQTGAEINTVTTSNTITVSGICSPSAISITGGTYSVNGGGYTSSAGTVNNGDTVTVRQTSSGSYSTQTHAVLTIGGVSDTFSVTTKACADTTPDGFIFTDQTGAELSTVTTSNTITVSGICASSAISITGGTYSVNGGGYTSLAGTVNNGDTVTVRQTSSGSFLTTTDAVLTIGGVSDTFSVTTNGTWYDHCSDYSCIDNWDLESSGIVDITVTKSALSIVIDKPLDGCSYADLTSKQTFDGENLLVETAVTLKGYGEMLLRLKKDDDNFVQFGVSGIVGKIPDFVMGSSEDGTYTEQALNLSAEYAVKKKYKFKTFSIVKTGDEYRLYLNGMDTGETITNTFLGDAGLKVELLNSVCSTEPKDLSNYFDYVLVSDTIDGSIPADPLTLLTPDGGETINIGSIYLVLWEGPAGADYYSIAYSANSGLKWKLLDTGIEGNFYTWKLQKAKPYGTYRLRVNAHDSLGNILDWDDSDSDFTVQY